MHSVNTVINLHDNLNFFWWNGEYRKLKETYVDVFPVEITIVNFSYNASMKWNISYEEQIQ